MRFTYSIIEDIRMYRHTKRRMPFFIEEGLYVIPWTVKGYITFIRNYFTYERPKIDNDMTCYFVSCGTWGAYRPPNTVLVCPIDFEKSGMTMGDNIMHEITHIAHEHDVKNMTHAEKESYIRAIGKK